MVFEGQAQYYINHLAQPAQRAGTAASIVNIVGKGSQITIQLELN